MKKLTFSIFALLVFSFILLSIPNETFSQPAHRGKERLKQVRKMKLLDILDLDEATTDKFLAKYSSYEKKIEEKKFLLDSIADELRPLLKKKGSKEEIKKLTQKFSDTQDELLNLIKERNKEMKQILNETEYAKFLIFDNQFTREVQEILIEKGLKKKKKDINFFNYPGPKYRFYFDPDPFCEFEPFIDDDELFDHWKRFYFEFPEFDLEPPFDLDEELDNDNFFKPNLDRNKFKFDYQIKTKEMSLNF